MPGPCRRRHAIGDGSSDWEVRMTTEAFYAAVGGISFTLLGLWWVVVIVPQGVAAVAGRGGCWRTRCRSISCCRA